MLTSQGLTKVYSFTAPAGLVRNPTATPPTPVYYPHCWLGVRDLIFQVGTSLESTSRSISALFSGGRKTRPRKLNVDLGESQQIPTQNFSPVQCGTDPFHSHQTNIQEEPDLFLLFRLVIPASASSLGDRVLSSLTTEPCPALGQSWEWKEV